MAAPAGAEPVFNGKDLAGWFVQPDQPAVWRVVKDKDGTPAIARQPAASCLWTKASYGDFVLELEFKVSPGCNSGIFFRSEPDNPVQRGFEIQVFDSHGEAPDKHNTGALYDAKAADAMPEKPPGQWNTLKLEARGPRLVVHINDVKVQDLDLDAWTTPNQNPDGSPNKFKTALKDLPRTGHIGFQDHGHDVWYRNIRIQAL
jgi:hypothetical protein